MRTYSKECPHCDGRLVFPSTFYRFIKVMRCDSCTCYFCLIAGRVKPARGNRCTPKVRA